MESLRHDDPRRIASYALLGHLDSAMAPLDAPERRFIARDLTRAQTVLISLPLTEVAHDASYSTRFFAEAEQARRLSPHHPWMEPVVEVAPAGENQWRAASYVPCVSLSDAVALNGPLPEETVRIVGAFLAEALSQAHHNGFVHAGVTPATVLLTGTTPRLTGFGTARAAAADGHDRSAVPGLIAACTAPEQLTGGRPRPLGDVYGLGATLAFAASGQLSPERSELPTNLRRIIAACLRNDPADRPPTVDLARAFVASRTGTAQAPEEELRTVLDRSAEAPAVPDYAWLPKRVLAAIAGQSAEVLLAAPELDAEVQSQAATMPTPDGGRVRSSPHDSTSRTGQWPEAESPKGVLEGDPQSVAAAEPQRRFPTRRALFSGVAGLGLGAGGVVLSERIHRASPPKSSVRKIEGIPPVPLWQYSHSGDSTTAVPLLWQDKILVLAGPEKTVGLDSRSGKRRWTASEVGSDSPPCEVTKDHIMASDTGGVKFLSARSGSVSWGVEDYGFGTLLQVLGVVGDTVWLGVQEGSNGDGVAKFVAAYDAKRRKEVWRTQLPGQFTFSSIANGYETDFRILHQRDHYVIPETDGTHGVQAKRAKNFVALDGDGRELWRKTFDGVPLEAEVFPLGEGRFLSVHGDLIQAFRITGESPIWSLKIESGARAWGAPAVDAENVYIADSRHVTYALDKLTGRTAWKRDPELMVPELLDDKSRAHLTKSGKTLLITHTTGVLAFGSPDGKILWRFSDVKTSFHGTGANPGPMTAFGDKEFYIVNGNTVSAIPVS